MPSPSRPLTLLMTATIDPKDCPDSRFSVPERQAMYLKAFRFYLRKVVLAWPHARLLFCENSGADLAPFRALIPESVADRVRLFSAPWQQFTPAKGKTYNEVLLMEMALADLPTDWQADLFFKVTGRYAILNIRAFLRDCFKAGPVLAFYCDQKDHTLWERLGRHWNGHWGETRFFAFTLPFWQAHFQGKAGRDTRVFEGFIYDLARTLYGRDDCRFRFRQEPFIHGLAGGNSVNLLGHHIPKQLEEPYMYLRAFGDTLLRRLFPRWWF